MVGLLPRVATRAAVAVALGRLQYEPVLAAIGWGLVCWIVVFWRLGYPSFWDPDEAHYAETTREMLAAREWLVPLYDGVPFFDKPVLFHTLQMLAFKVLGPTELAARAVPAVSALALFACMAWLGRVLFSREVGRLGRLMFAVLPATFALSAYAIPDMTFTLFLFSGSALVGAAALGDRPRLQYPGYVLLAAAVLVKGPLALALAGLAWLLSLAIAPAARHALLRLRWGFGLMIVIGLSGPWFAHMWWRFRSDFVEGYLFHENLWLYARNLYGGQPSYFFYVKVMAVGLLPWTPVLVGRLIDVARGQKMESAERLLWAWVLAGLGFFTFSRFKLDHYIYPVAPALCLLCAHAWAIARRAEHLSWGVTIGALGTGIVLVAAGVLLVPALDRLPIELSGWARLMPASLLAAGAFVIARMSADRLRPTAVPLAPVGSLLLSYALIVLIAFPSLEQAKPIRDLAHWVATTTAPNDHVATFRLNRWNSSWRFYVDRHTEALETPHQIRNFMARPGHHYCALQEHDFRALALEYPSLRVVHKRRGLFVTTGRALRAGRGAGWRTFLVVSDVEPSPRSGRAASMKHSP